MNPLPIPPPDPSQQRIARFVGFLYLLQMATAVFGQVAVRDRLLVRGDVAKTAQNIIESEGLFRLSIAGDLVTYAGVIALVWGLHVILRPVDRNLSLLAVMFRVVENAVLITVTVSSLVVLRLLSGADYLNAFAPGQLHSLARLALAIQGLGMNVGFLLLGVGSAIFAWVLLKSRYVPTVFALWGIIASLVLAAGSLVLIALPGVGAIGRLYMMPMGLYEVGLGLWLLVKGLKAAPDTPARSTP